MKALNVMMAIELLDLQIEQINLLQEELSLKRKVLDIEQKLGLSSEVWRDARRLEYDCKRKIYHDILEDYIMTQEAIAKLEQKEAEELHELEESKRLLEVSSIAQVNGVKELKPHESHEEIVDTNYEVVEKEEHEHFVLKEAEENKTHNKSWWDSLRKLYPTRFDAEGNWTGGPLPNELDDKKDTIKK